MRGEGWQELSGASGLEGGQGGGPAGRSPARAGLLEVDRR